MSNKSLFFFSLLIIEAVFALITPAHAKSIGFDLIGYTDSSQVTPRFDCEGGGTYEFPYEDSGAEGSGKIGRQHCELNFSLLANSRDFHLQSIGSTGNQQNDTTYKVSTSTGEIIGRGLLNQNAIFFNNLVMNYGVSRVGAPLQNQAYVYTGNANSAWMGYLANTYPNIQIKNLVLPGSHDAGMYTMNVLNTALAARRMCDSADELQVLCGLGGLVGTQLLANVALTQKDTAFNQLRFGVRFFDFRPAYASNGEAYHLHNFIAGVKFKDFLQDVNKFLKENPSELVFIQITSSGIASNTNLATGEEGPFKPLTQTQVEQFLSENVTSVGYDLTSRISNYNEKTLVDVVKGGKRVIVVYGKSDVNDSYNDDAYAKAVDDPNYVLGALKETVNASACSSPTTQYTVLQLQDTGISALKNYKNEIIGNALGWRALLTDDKGSILQATKPIFDRATYSWLIQPDTLAALKKCTSPVVLLNDFVDTAMTSRSIALSKYRGKN